MFTPRDAHQTGEHKDRAIVAHGCLQGVAKGGGWDPEALVLAVGPAEPSGGTAGPGFFTTTGLAVREAVRSRSPSTCMIRPGTRCGRMK